MTSPESRDIIRYTLQSYVGSMFTETKMSGRQKEAIRRLSSLRRDKFQELCHDIINEIHRRGGVKYNTDNKMIQKFAMLSTEKFKNLVVDTLIVYYQKNPEARMEEPPAFLENLGTLIESLKVDSEREIFLERLKRLEFYNKIQEFVSYSTGFGIDREITDHINECVLHAIERESTHFIECFSYPETLLQKIEESEPFKALCRRCPDILEEFQTSKKLVFDAIERRCMSAARDELLKIMKAVIHSTTIPAKRIECFGSEIKAVIGALESVKHDLEGISPADLSVLSRNLGTSVDQIIKKSKDEGLSTETVNSLHIHKVTLEGLPSSVSRIEAFSVVLCIAKELRDIFKSISFETISE